MKKYLPLVIWVLALQCISGLLGLMTTANLTPWYASLSKSALTPPGYVFGIVWTILYAVLAVVAWQLYQKSNRERLLPLRITFAAQLLLNFLWTPLFFHWHFVGLGLACVLFIAVITAAFLILALRQSRGLFWLMLPYWLWVCFASYLNFFIWQH